MILLNYENILSSYMIGDISIEYNVLMYHICIRSL